MITRWSESRQRLDAFLETLLEEETMGEGRLRRILGPRPAAEPPSRPERQLSASSSVR
jgi:hypothetical protein